MKFLSVFCTVATVTLLLGTGVAQAGPCTIDKYATLTNATSCGLGNGKNDDTTGDAVKLAEPSDLEWEFIEKDENTGDGTSGELFSDPVGTGKNGTWEINNTSFDNYLIVLKGGPKWAWFIVEGTSGTWEMLDKDLSHMSLLGANDGGNITNVPEPVSLALLGTGIIGIAFIRRRK